MELHELVGLHKLSGVDFSTEHLDRYGYDEACSAVNFVLDNVTYSAIEDPDDGYRSTMREIKVSNFAVKNTFAPVQVLCMLDDTDNDVLHIVDTTNGKIVLSIGTDHSDNYYPTFLSDWRPENLSLNANA